MLVIPLCIVVPSSLEASSFLDGESEGLGGYNLLQVMGANAASCARGGGAAARPPPLLDVTASAAAGRECRRRRWT
jgi:hypothetical protein